MAPDIKINIKQSEDGESFYFQDDTPLLNPVSAPNGYDVSGSFGGFDPNNIDTATVKVRVTIPNGDIYVINVDPSDIVIANIGTIGMVNIAITSTDLGTSGDITDGIYFFEYTFKDTDGVSYSAKCYVAAMYQVCCCLNKKLIDITTCTNCPEKERSRKINDLYDAWMLKFKAEHLVGCNNYTAASQIIEHLTSYCNIKRCATC